MKESNTPAAVRPLRIEIADLAHLAFPTAAVLLNQGYVFCGNNPPEAYATGYANIVLVRGEHTDYAIAHAEAAEAIALARQQVAEQRNAEAAARETAEAVERAEKEATAQAEIEGHRKAIAALQRKLRAA